MINPEIYKKLPLEVQDELSKVKFNPITERDNELKSSASHSDRKSVV